MLIGFPRAAASDGMTSAEFEKAPHLTTGALFFIPATKRILRVRGLPGRVESGRSRESAVRA
jgi:hypothetical protein